MADAVGSFVTRAFERMLKDATGRKNGDLREAIKVYLETVKSSTTGAKNDSESEKINSKGPRTSNSSKAISAAGTSSFFQRLLGPPLKSSSTAGMALAEGANNSEDLQVDLAVLPLRLAIQSKQAKLVETALDCFHKLVAFGLLEGVAGLENSGKTESMTTQLFNVICTCADNNASHTVVLQVIKALLTAVASSSFEGTRVYLVHLADSLPRWGNCAPLSIHFHSAWELPADSYDNMLQHCIEQSVVNQATAKATLTQMSIVKCKRLESLVQVQSSLGAVNSHSDGEGFPKKADSVNRVSLVDDDKPEISAVSMGISSTSGETAPTSKLTLEELQVLAGGSNVKGLEAALDQAVFAEGQAKTGNGLHTSNFTIDEQDALLMFRTICEMSMKDGDDIVVDKTRILSLEVLQAYLCYALVRACVSTNPLIFQLSCSIFAVLLQRLRGSLKEEVAVFFPLVILRALDNLEIPLQQQTTVLKMLENLCLDPQLLADVFVNYDCDLAATNLFERMVNSLSKIAQGTSDLPQPNSPEAEHMTVNQVSSLQCLVNVLKALMEWTVKHQDSMDLDGESSSLEGLKGKEAIEAYELESREDGTTRGEADYGKAKAHKSTMEAAVAEFNRKPEKGVKALFEFKLAEKEPTSVAKFLRTTPGLDKVMIGDYLGQHEAFQLSVMHAYIDQFNFAGMAFDQAIRELLNGFRLPGEAQKIDRIMEKFAERFCNTNPGLFKNADTAYVLAYAVIMLNTDAHNPMVKEKMTKADFVKINSGQPGDQEEHAPRELLEGIYDSIVKDEIKLKGDTAKNLAKRKDLEEKSRLVSVLKLRQPKKRAVDTKVEGERIVQNTQDLFKKGGMKRGVFHVAKQLELARPMLEAIGWPLLATFSASMEKSNNHFQISLCMEGFQMGVHLTKVLTMDAMRCAILTTLIRFTYMHSLEEVSAKSIEALKTLLEVIENEPDALQDTWNSLLECVSRLEYLATAPTTSLRLLHGGNPALVQSLVQLTGRPTEQVFVKSASLPSDMIVEFFTALCCASSDELQQIPPRVFSLQKLVEISYYNMSRIRMVWAKIWGVLALHFVAAGSHEDEQIAMYSIDALRQLAIKYLERSELSNFSFQNDILKPFVILMRNSRSVAIRALIVDCIVQMIKSKVTSIKSGWRSVFMVFTTAATDQQKDIADIAFENVEQGDRRDEFIQSSIYLRTRLSPCKPSRHVKHSVVQLVANICTCLTAVILEHFDQVVEGCLIDCVNCLLSFANNKASPSNGLKAIALLSICEDRLAEGLVRKLWADASFLVDGLVLISDIRCFYSITLLVRRQRLFQAGLISL